MIKRVRRTKKRRGRQNKGEGKARYGERMRVKKRKNK